MNKLLIFGIIYFICFKLTAQSLSLSAGFNYNNLYDFEDQTPHYSSKYIGEFGFASSLTLGIKNQQSKIINPQFSVSIMQVSSKYELNTASQGGGSTTIGEFSNKQFSLSIFPLSTNLSNNIEINLGFEFNLLISENNTAEQKMWQIGQTPNVKNISEYRSSSLIYGLTSGLNFYTELSENSKIIYQYIVFFGLVDEYYNGRSFRNQFQIGFSRAF